MSSCERKLLQPRRKPFIEISAFKPLPIRQDERLSCGLGTAGWSARRPRSIGREEAGFVGGPGEGLSRFDGGIAAELPSAAVEIRDKQGNGDLGLNHDQRGDVAFRLQEGLCSAADGVAAAYRSRNLRNFRSR